MALWISIVRGPSLAGALTGPQEDIPNFFQDYASARNVLEGLPVYTDHRLTAPRYLEPRLASQLSYVTVNAHPPSSVLLALPFARLEFREAFVAWNLASLGILIVSMWVVWHQLQIPSPLWSIFPVFTLLLLCQPLREQFRWGQLSLILTGIITWAWAAERSGRPRLAGSLLGVAVAIKLFPGFLLVYFAMRRRWTAVVWGTASLCLLTVFTAAILGLDACHDYWRVVLPEIRWFRVGWNNASLAGFWSRLFDPAPERPRSIMRTLPLWYSPALASIGTLASSATVAGALAFAVHRDPIGRRKDVTFGLAVTAMLLIAPVTWEHSFLMLMMPLAAFWRWLPSTRLSRATFVVCIIGLWIEPARIWGPFGLEFRVAGPGDAFGPLSYSCYSLLGLFTLGLIEAACPKDERLRVGEGADSSHLL